MYANNWKKELIKTKKERKNTKKKNKICFYWVNTINNCLFLCLINLNTSSKFKKANIGMFSTKRDV